MDDKVVAKAKRIARQRHQSVSKMVEEHLNGFDSAKNKKVPNPQIAEWIQELWKMNDKWRKTHSNKKRILTKKDEDDARYEYLKKKYL